MTESSVPVQAASFEECQAILAQELELALRWHKACLLLVACDSDALRMDMVSVLETHLLETEHVVRWLHGAEQQPSGQSQRLADEQVIFFMDGLTELLARNTLQVVLDQLLTTQSAPLVFWLTFREASMLAYQAPAIWACRSRLVDLTIPPQLEQVLQTALEATWQNTAHHHAHNAVLEEKIYRQKTTLAELPLNAETAATRATLLLTLGILHWRKGDHELATSVLQQALKITAALQDHQQLEAACLNALALVQSSRGNIETAISAYKEAIKVAPHQLSVWNNLGNLCLKINRQHEAMLAFQKALEHNPQDAIAWNGMGDVYARNGYEDDAVTAYNEASACAPHLAHPWHGLGEVFAQSGRYAEALHAFREAIKRNKQWVAPWVGLAKLCAQQKQYRDATRAYHQALALAPSDHVLWNELGCLQMEADLLEDAQETFTRTIEICANDGWAYSNLALVYTRQGKPQDSIALYRKSLELLTDTNQKTMTWNRLATAHRLCNDYEHAIKAYQMADARDAKPVSIPVIPVMEDETHDPTHDQPATVSEAGQPAETESATMVERGAENPLAGMAQVVTPPHEDSAPYWVFESDAAPDVFTNELLEMTDIQTSLSETRGSPMHMLISAPTTVVQSHSIAPSQPTDAAGARVWNEKGNDLFRAGAFEDATHSYNRAIKLDRVFGLPYCNLGITYLQLGRYAEALLLLHKSLELLDSDADRAIAWNELGNLYRCLNDYHNALVAYQKADELNPEHAGVCDTVESLHLQPSSKNAHIWTELGDTFFKGGSYPKASECYQKALDMEPTNGMVCNNLALSLTYQSRFEEAVRLYEHSLDLLSDDKSKADTWNRLGNVYRRLYDYDKAIAAYQNAVKLKHDQKPLLTRARFSLLGNCYVEQ